MLKRNGLLFALTPRTLIIHSDSDSTEETKDNTLPPLDSAMLELLSFEETELLALISQAEADQIHLQEKIKKCNQDIQSQIEAIAEEDSKLENIVKQFV
jgi:hypothetical protein